METLIPVEFVFVDESTSVKGGVDIADLLVRSDLAHTKSEGRRHIEGGAIRINDQPLTDPFARLAWGEGKMVIIQRRR